MPAAFALLADVNVDLGGANVGMPRELADDLKRLAGLSKPLEMERDRLADEFLVFFARVGDDAEPGQVWAVGAPALALALDHDQILVFAHRSGHFRPA
ncbi:MAG: hypothetical protein QOH12_1860 [Solirubrobacteraceae bacterium]|jgi:hypothetical protein|nr:hypothetical protein [Solirubrobacteraceae bacterium]